MEFKTTVTIAPGGFQISPKEKTILLGSCFVENIGTYLIENKFQVDLNPFGIIYNPASVASSLYRLLDPEPFRITDLFQHQGVYHSFSHHSRFSGTDPEQVLSHINGRLQTSSDMLCNIDRLIITFGTARIYKEKISGRLVSNCHKLPDKTFDRVFLSVEDIVLKWKTLLAALFKKRPGLQILFTVSPVRHWKDGAHGNQLSKATLLLAVEQLCGLYPGQIHYFPSYEIMLDELRDYRFYADDMLHPSPLAFRYIRERFADTYFTPETQELLTEWEVIRKALLHKPFHPDSEAYRSFIMQTLLKAEQLEQKFPYFYMTKERDLLLSKLK